MAWIEMVPEREAVGLVKEIYDDKNVGAAAIMAVAYVIITTVIILSF